jgi:hypothetical protein
MGSIYPPVKRMWVLQASIHVAVPLPMAETRTCIYLTRSRKGGAGVMGHLHIEIHENNYVSVP